MPALDDFSNEDFANMAAAIEAGTAPDDLVDELADLLLETPAQRLEEVASEEGAALGFDDEGNPLIGEGKTALVDLIDAVQEATGQPVDGVVVEADGVDDVDDVEEPPEPLDAEAEEAVRMVERLLSPTSGRDADFFFALREALETGDASFSGAITQETLDTIPPDRRQRLADRAEDLARGVAVSGMTRADFPDVENATEPGPGRTVANYWQPLLQQLESGDPQEADILRDQGVPDDQIRALFANSNVLNEFIQKVEGNIENIRGGRGGPTLTDAPGQADTGGPGIDISDITDSAIEATVRRMVPGRSREDWTTGESWTASRQQIETEQRFVNWLIREFGGPDGTRWDAADFQVQPENRDRTMAQWARLQVQAGNTTPNSALQMGLPEEWFEGL